MTNNRAYFLNAMGMVNALGTSPSDIAGRLFRAQSPLVSEQGWLPHQAARVGRVFMPLPAIPDALKALGSRTNQLLLQALQAVEHEVEAVLSRYGRSRVAVLIGTSNSGIQEGTEALSRVVQGLPPEPYCYQQQELGSSALFLAAYLGVTGPAYVISTACTSSAKVFSAGLRLLDAGMCDAVLLGGADALAQLTVSGFTALESTDQAVCRPMSRTRSGINIGEGAALFVLSREPAAIELLGVGESTDAYHISSPHPEGNGAEQAMRQALQQAKRQPDEVHYLNLHGTGTEKNDAMEAKAVSRVFSSDLLVSSTKPMTGHLLGAAGASEVGLCCLALQYGQIPPHLWDGQVAPSLPPLRLATENQRFPVQGGRVCMSNSFAFGGNNASVLIGDAR